MGSKIQCAIVLKIIMIAHVKNCVIGKCSSIFSFKIIFVEDMARIGVMGDSLERYFDNL